VTQGWSREAADFINKLIQRKPASRLGLNGPDEVKEHVWFKDFDWDELFSKKKTSPFIPPQSEDNLLCLSQVDNAEKSEQCELVRVRQQRRVD